MGVEFIKEMNEEIKKLNKKLAQHKYHNSELGRQKIIRNNARRRLKTYYKKVMKELLKFFN